MDDPGLHWPKAIIWFDPVDEGKFQLDCNGVKLGLLEGACERILEMIKDGSLIASPDVSAMNIDDFEEEDD